MPSASDERDGPFYVAGGTLPPSATSYVLRAADTALLAALQDGAFCYVLNTRQMGKSSLMARTAQLLRLAGTAVAVLDLTAVGQNLTPVQWYRGLLAGIGEQLGLEQEIDACWAEHAEAGPMQRFLGALRRAALPALPGALVIFIDEIDAVRSLPFSTDELFAGIRALYNRRVQDPELNRLTFCLLGVATPADLIRDTRTTPFNVGVRMDLSDFTPVEAMPLVRGMAGGKAVLERVLYWTGGHPYLTQCLCRAVADEPTVITRPAQVDALCLRLFLSPQAQVSEDNLLFVRDRLLRSELDPAALLSVYGRVLRGRPAVSDDPADPLVSVLKLAGVVKPDPRGRLVVRNRIYERVFGRAWVRENMPGAELRRQRRAFRRGALRAGAIASVVVALVGTLAGIAVREARYAQREARQAQDQAARFERLLYVSDMQNAQTAWDDGNLGRLRALLAQTRNSPERGFEWGYWNALAHPAGDAVQVGSAPLGACAATKDGAKLLTAGGDGMVRLWDTRTLHQIYRVRYPGPAMSGIRFSADGSRWSAWDDAGGLTIYDTARRKRLFSLPSDQLNYPNFTSPDLKIAVRHVHDAATMLINTETGRNVGLLPHRSGPVDWTTGDFPANVSDRMFWFDENPADASVYDMTTGHRICRLQLPPRLQPPGHVVGAFSDDDRTLVTLAGAHNDYDLWDAATGRLIRHLDNVLQSILSFYVVDPNAPLVLIRSDDRLRAYSTRTGKRLLDCLYPEALEELQPGVFSPDGRYLGFVGANGAVSLFDCKTGKIAGTYLGHTAASTNIVFLPQGHQFISVSADGSLRLWNRDEVGQKRWNKVHFPGNAGYGWVDMLRHRGRAVINDKLRFSLWRIAADRAVQMRFLDGNWTVNANDTTLTTWATRGAYTEYALADGHIIGHWTCDKLHTGIAGVSSDGRYLASYSKSGLTSVTDMRGNRRLWSARGSNSNASVLIISPSGNLVASGGGDMLVDVWAAHTGRKIAALSGSNGGVQSLTFLQGDRHLAAVGTDQTLRCWDIATGRLLWAVQTPPASSWPLQQSPDGGRLLMTSADGSVLLWDAQTGDQLLKIKAVSHDPKAEFSVDGSRIEVNDELDNYRDYLADMRPRDDPAPDAAAR